MATSILDNVKDRFEDLLKAKTLDELREELKEIADEIQKEISILTTTSI